MILPLWIYKCILIYIMILCSNNVKDLKIFIYFIIIYTFMAWEPLPISS
jgi:hypothetical protein